MDESRVMMYVSRVGIPESRIFVKIWRGIYEDTSIAISEETPGLIPEESSVRIAEKNYGGIPDRPRGGITKSFWKNLWRYVSDE